MTKKVLSIIFGESDFFPTGENIRTINISGVKHTLIKEANNTKDLIRKYKGKKEIYIISTDPKQFSKILEENKSDIEILQLSNISKYYDNFLLVESPNDINKSTVINISNNNNQIQNSLPIIIEEENCCYNTNGSILSGNFGTICGTRIAPVSGFVQFKRVQVISICLFIGILIVIGKISYDLN